jgi:hypothetical protein
MVAILRVRSARIAHARDTSILLFDAAMRITPPRPCGQLAGKRVQFNS